MNHARTSMTTCTACSLCDCKDGKLLSPPPSHPFYFLAIEQLRFSMFMIIIQLAFILSLRDGQRVRHRKLAVEEGMYMVTNLNRRIS